MTRLASAWFLLLPLLAACSRHADPSAAAAGPARPVRTVVVAEEMLPNLLEVPATVRPAERAVLAAKLTGTVASDTPGVGQAVAAGAVLLTLSAPETEARVHQAQAQLAEAERAADRARTLVAKGVNPADSLRDAEDRLRFAQAALAEAEALLSYATVRAPFAGVITEKHVLTGDLATPGLPLLALESIQNLRAEGTVPERTAAGLHLGDPLPVVLEDGAAPVSGKIEELSGSADAISRSLLVKVALPAGVARSGQLVRLQPPAGSSPALLVPAEAVTAFGQIERVFVSENGRAVLRIVKTGRTAGARREILAGLSAGDRVILTAPAELRDGMPVTEQP